MGIGKRPIYIMLFCLCLGLLPYQSEAGSGTNEYEVKAAFIYQFAHFVEWPSSAFSSSSSPLVIAVLGDDPYGRVLDDIVRGKEVSGHSIVIKRYESLGDVQYSQILYVSSSEKKRLSRVLDKVKGKPTLTVSDIVGFAKQNGMIELTFAKDRIGLDINVATARQVKLKISSKLLRLANVVRD